MSNLPSDDPRTGLVLRLDKHTSDGDTAYAHADGYTAREGLTWFEDQMVHPLVLQDLIRLSWLNTFIAPVQGMSEIFPRHEQQRHRHQDHGGGLSDVGSWQRRETLSARS